MLTRVLKSRYENTRNDSGSNRDISVDSRRGEMFFGGGVTGHGNVHFELYQPFEVEDRVER